MSLFMDLMEVAYEATCTALGIDYKANPQNIRPLNYTDSPAALNKPDEDLAYYLVEFGDSPLNRQIDVEYGKFGDKTTEKKTHRCRNIRIIWQTYGGNGFENADKIRERLFDDDIREIFRSAGMSLVTDVPEPVFIPELLGTQWYKRYDLYADFNQLVTENKEIDLAASARVVVKTDEGIEEEC